MNTITLLKPYILLALIILSIACKQKPKTPEEIYEEKMETYSDDQLLEDYYGTTQNYRVLSVTPKSSCPNSDNEIIPNVKSGAVIQVIYHKGKIYVKGVGTMFGSYEKGYYANEDGSVTAKFLKYEPASYAGLKPYDGKRVHPSSKSERLGITIEGEHNNYQNFKCKATINYTLLRLDN